MIIVRLRNYSSTSQVHRKENKSNVAKIDAFSLVGFFMDLIFTTLKNFLPFFADQEKFASFLNGAIPLYLSPFSQTLDNNSIGLVDIYRFHPFTKPELEQPFDIFKTMLTSYSNQVLLFLVVVHS